MTLIVYLLLILLVYYVGKLFLYNDYGDYGTKKFDKWD
jgi:hypothetical protein